MGNGFMVKKRRVDELFAPKSLLKKPWVKSAFFPGLGQIQCGYIKKGVLFFISSMLYYFLWISSWHSYIRPRFAWLPPSSAYFRTHLVPLILLILWILNVFDARKMETVDHPINQTTVSSISTMIISIELCIFFASFVVLR